MLLYNLQQTLSQTLEVGEKELNSLSFEDPGNRVKIESTISLARGLGCVIHPGESYMMIDVKISS